MIVAFDLDGTLANIEHRLPLIKCAKPNWDKFYESVGGDSVNEWCAQMMTGMAFLGHRIVIVSARRDTTEKDTKKWLDQNNINYSELNLLRKGNKDFRPDVDLKREWARKNKEDILFVVDDRQKVVDMWRDEGVICLQCAKWDEFKGGK